MARRRKLFFYADRFGLTRQERIDLAEMVLRRDIASWKALTDLEVSRMLDTLEGYALVSFLLSERA